MKSNTSRNQRRLLWVSKKDLYCESNGGKGGIWWSVDEAKNLSGVQFVNGPLAHIATDREIADILEEQE